MEEHRTAVRQKPPGECGFFCCKSPCLQRLSHVNVFMIVFSAIFILSLSVAGYLAGVVSTLEKRFQLKSSEVGAITTVSSIVSLSLVVFLSYYGQNKHRPRLIAIGSVFVGVGTILMSFPQFLYGAPPFLTVANGTKDNELCNAGNSNHGNSNSSCDIADDITLSSSSYGVAWLIVGQIIIGIGSSAFMPLAITFIDDNVDRTSTALYVGVLFASTGIAPIVGFGLSSLCLSQYSDFYKTSSAPKEGDHNWLGAWWLGFVIYGITTLALAVPMFMFPKRISERQEDDDDGVGVNDEDEVFANGRNDDPLNEMLGMRNVYTPTSEPIEGGSEKFSAVKGFLGALCRILTNPAYVIIVFGVCLTFAAISGFFTFGAKYIETQYNVPTSYSPLILGGMVAPGAIVGNFLGGVIVKRFKLTEMGFARMILLIAIPMTCISPVLFFLGCDNPDVAGLTTTYNTKYAVDVNATSRSVEESYNGLNLQLPDSRCNSHCQCDTVYSPVCGSDGITYVSPCYARCTEVSEDDNNNTVYLSCGCVSPTNTANATEDQLPPYSAVKGECNRDCNMLWVFTTVFLVIFFFNCIWSNPAFMLYLRLVDERDRSIGVGFASLALKVLGFIPAPIFYGKAIQATCLFSKQLSCEETGACLLHDIHQFRFNFLGLTYGLQLLVTLSMIVGYFAVKRQTKGFKRMRVVTIERSANNPMQPRPSRLPSSFFVSDDNSNSNGHKAL